MGGNTESSIILPGGGGGGGSGVAWGAITGTLTDQTDLATALNAKAPKASPTFTGTIGTPLTGSSVVQTDVSGNLTAGKVGISQINATGSPSSANFLRGDGAWAAGGNAIGPGTSVAGNLAYFTGTDGVTLGAQVSPSINSRGTGLDFGFTSSGVDQNLWFGSSSNAMWGTNSGMNYSGLGQWNINIGNGVSNTQYMAGLSSIVYCNFPMNWSCAQTTTAGSAGNIKWAQTIRGGSHKLFVGYMTGYTGAAATISFPSAFSNTPYIYGDPTAVASASATTTTLTLTATTVTGNLFIEGY